MARPLRIEIAGGCYHVMNRGNQGARVFLSDGEHRLFLEKLERFALEFDVAVNSYCLMPNHFHVVLTTRQANLGRFMQSWLTSFTVSLNRLRDSAGHVFQGRYKAHLVDTQRYMSELTRYVHLNPTRTKRAEAFGLKQRRALLNGYEWSSFPVLIGVRPTPEWMDVTPVLATWGVTEAEQMQKYRRYVDQGLTVDLPNPFLSIKEQTILGSDSFVDQIRRRYLLERQLAAKGEEPALDHLMHSLDPQEVLAAVALSYGVESDELLRRRSPYREARRVAMYLTSLHCRHAVSLTHLAAMFSLTVGGLCTTRARVEGSLEQPGSGIFQARIEHIMGGIRGRGRAELLAAKV